MTNLEYVYKSKLLKNFSFWSVPRRHVSLHKAALLAPLVSFAPQVKLSQSFYQNKMLPKFLIHFFFFLQYCGIFCETWCNFQIMF